MKGSKRYLAFAVAVFGALLLKYNQFGEEYQSVESFRGAHLDEDTWNPLIAQSVNENLLSVVIDNKEYTNEQYHFYMDESLNLMVPVSILRDALNCSAHIYEEDTLLVEKHNKELSFSLSSGVLKVNGEKVNENTSFVRQEKAYYVSLNELSQYLDYSYSWNIAENKAQAADISESTAIIPAQYDLREQKRISAIRNQGTYGTCWSFAALSAMESVLLPEETYQFSVDHMTLNNGFNLTQDDGGEYTMGMAYLASWHGPVYEKDDPYGDNQTNTQLKAVKHVQEMQIIHGKDYEKIKEAVFKYGGVQTSIYNALKSSQSQSPYYDKKTSSYCYIGTEKPNHDVVIIGWDDNYPKENFSVDLEGDGAFLCQNSWGSEFGDGGVFYVSYYDTNIGTHNVVYTKIEDSDNYDYIYQSDLCGWIGQMGYNKESIYGANIFTAQSDESLKAASFYATGRNSQYQVYIVKNFKDTDSFDEMQLAAEGKLGNAGYYTVEFEDEIFVDAGERYAVVLFISTPNAIHPLAIEYAADKATENVILDDGEGYVSANGFEWENVKKIENCNLCIKVFSNHN